MGVIFQLDRTGWTPIIAADNAISTAAGYEGYIAGAAPDLARIIEVFENGEVSSSTVNVMAVRRDGTNAATPTAKTPGKANPSSPANLGTYFQTASTQPTNANATHILNCSINAYGGEVRWVAPYGGELYLIGGSANNNEAQLGAVSGTPGQMSSHIAVEEL